MAPRSTDSVRGTILFHSPCFDGVASAVLTHDCLSAKAGWTRIALKAVNYQLSGRWLQAPLRPNTAVVDFLFHPMATFWADHHTTAFLDGSSLVPGNRRNRWLAYDATALSCASLLKHHFSSRFRHRATQFDELVGWADKIDSADYASPEQAMSMDLPAVRINLSLMSQGTSAFAPQLVRWLLQEPLERVAARRTVSERAAKVLKKLRAGLTAVQKSARLTDDGIVVFDIDQTTLPIPRYGPYHFFPSARYSVGLVRTGAEAKVTAMRNPWRRFNSVPLGGVMARHGGGGHHRVASVVLRNEEAAKATEVLNRVLADIRKGERQLVR